MSLPLYRQGLRSCYKIVLVVMAVLTLYMTVIITMFDPKFGAALDLLATAMPQLMAMVGMTAAGGSLAGFMASYLYGFVIPIFPMISSILIAVRLVSRLVDRGSMAYLLAAPHTRGCVVRTQLSVLLTSIVVLIAYVAVLGVGVSAAVFPGELDMTAFLLLNLGALCLHLCLGSMCFLASCAFDETRLSVALGAGVPVAMFVLQMVSNMGGGTKFLRFFTVFTLFDPRAIVARGLPAMGGCLALALIAAALYAIGTVLFQRRDLPL